MNTKDPKVVRRHQPPPAQGTKLVDELLAIARRCAALPVQERRLPDEVQGFDGDGLPS